MWRWTGPVWWASLRASLLLFSATPQELSSKRNSAWTRSLLSFFCLKRFAATTHFSSCGGFTNGFLLMQEHQAALHQFNHIPFVCSPQIRITFAFCQGRHHTLQALNVTPQKTQTYSASQQQFGNGRGELEAELFGPLEFPLQPASFITQGFICDTASGGGPKS